MPDLDIQHALAAPPPEEIESLAQRYALSSISVLVKLLTVGESDSARISAANEILDRGYGKPAVDIGGSIQLQLFGGVSAKPIAGEVRAECRKYAQLAIEVLRKIADNGKSEAARALAVKSILARGLGTAAPAKIDFDAPLRPLGKREQALADATEAVRSRDSDWGDDLQPRTQH